MEVRFEREGRTLIARVAGRVDGMSAAGSLRQIIEKELDAEDDLLIVDCEAMEYISSAGLRTVAILVNRTRRASTKLRVCSLRAPVAAVFRSTGFDKLVEVVPGIEQARRAA